MENTNEKQIVLIYKAKGPESSEEVMRYMVAHTLTFQQAYKTVDDKLFFAVDCTDEADLSSEPRADVIIVDCVSTSEEKAELRKLVYNANNNARIFVPLDCDYITRDLLNNNKRLITYSAEDQRANLCANKVMERPDGGFDIEIVYQAKPLGAKRGFAERLFPSYNKNIFTRAKVNSTERKDIIKMIKAYALGFALNLETKYIFNGVKDYDFESMTEKRQKDIAKGSASNSERENLREKEVDFD